MSAELRDETLTIPSMAMKRNSSECKIAPHERLKNNFKRNQYVFVKFRKLKKSKNPQIKSVPIEIMDESEKEDRVRAILEVGFQRPPDQD